VSNGIRRAAIIGSFTFEMQLRTLFLLALKVFMRLTVTAQVNAYYSAAAFCAPSVGPYIETSMAISGTSLVAQPVAGGFKNSVNVTAEIFVDCTLVRVNRYVLHGPVYRDRNAPPVFIDNQRYAVREGKCKIRMSLTDHAAPAGKALTIEDNVQLACPGGQLSGSSILPVESYSRAAKPGALTKSGYDMVPYNSSYYPLAGQKLSFYYELYNASSVAGEGKPLLLTWFIEEGSQLVQAGGFKKIAAATVNPHLASVDLSKLPSGNYNLVLEVRDQSNVLLQVKRMYFQRFNKRADLTKQHELAGRRTVAEYFGGCNSADTLQMFVECLWPIADNVDKERVINTAVKKDPDIMRKFAIDFWERRAADTANPLKMWADYYQQVQQVMKLFKCGKQKGYYTERGRVYLQYGAPNQRAVQAMEPNTFPYEIWQYYRITDGINGHFYSNRKFVFVNRNLGDDCHVLVHSDMRGEINNPRWPYEVSRRNSNGISNPDQNTPAGTDFNQFKEIYDNPR
jgi:GWxTD domain-containing protein